MAAKRKLNELSIEKKAEIITKFRQGVKKAELHRAYGVAKSTVSNIIGKQDEIMALFEKNCRQDRQHKIRKTEFDELNKLMTEWFHMVRSRDVPVSGPLICAEAKKLANKLGIQNFSASNGWLDKFKKANNINLHVVSGESAVVDLTVVDDWKAFFDLFSEWVNSLNANFSSRDRKILLFIDNAPVHSPDLDLSHVKVVFLPPNTTSLIQPLDQGVIRTFKAHYRHLLLNHVISKIDDHEHACAISSSISILSAVTWTVKAWSAVKPQCITNCFRKAGFDFSEREDEEEVLEENLAQLVHQIEPEIEEEMFLGFDDNIPTCDPTVFDDMIEAIYRAQQVREELEEEKEEENEEDEEEKESLTSAKAMELLDSLKLFLAEKHPEKFLDFDDMSNAIAKCIVDKKLINARQAKITHFFN